jgi:hypothetical protein
LREERKKPFYLSLSFLLSLCDLFLAYEYLPGSYMNQRVTPHYIENSAVGINVFKTAVNTLPPCTTYLSTEDILKEVDEVLRTKGNKIELNTQIATIPPITPGKGKRTGDTHLRLGDTKYPKLDMPVGSSTEPSTAVQVTHPYQPDLSGMSKG